MFPHLLTGFFIYKSKQFSDSWLKYSCHIEYKWSFTLMYHYIHWHTTMYKLCVGGGGGCKPLKKTWYNPVFWKIAYKRVKMCTHLTYFKGCSRKCRHWWKMNFCFYFTLFQISFLEWACVIFIVRRSLSYFKNTYKPMIKMSLQ